MEWKTHRGNAEQQPAVGMFQTGRWVMKPFAIQLYERFIAGETIEQLAAALGIPRERIAARIRAAESYIMQRRQQAA